MKYFSTPFLLFLIIFLLGMPAYSEITDCLGQNSNNGEPGQAICIAPIPKPRIDASANEHDKEGWVYHLYDRYPPGFYERVWCRAAGGALDDHGNCTSEIILFDEDIFPVAKNFADMVAHPCSYTVITDTGWGATITHSRGSISPETDPRTGILIGDARDLFFAGKNYPPKCDQEWYVHVWAGRLRGVGCPDGTKGRTTANGKYECWYMPADRCEETVGSGTPRTPGNPSPNNKSCSSNLVGNPINVGSLNKVQREEDLAVIPGGLSFAHYFNSTPLLPTDSETMRMAQDYWQHTYMRNIIEPYNNNGSILGVARRENGYLDYYDINGNPTTKNGSSKLQKNIDGWILTRGNGDKEYYDLEGKLIRISPLTGNEQTLTYSDETTPVEIAPDAGLLIEVADSYGRTLLFTYNEKSLLSSMADPAGNLFIYDYDDADRLSQVTYPDQTTRTYLYENTAFPYFLTGIVDHNGTRLSTYTYNANGQAIGTERAGQLDNYTIQITSDISVNRAITIHNALGGQIEKTYHPKGGILKPVYIAYRECPSCSASHENLYYDANGNLTEKRNRNGFYDQYFYNALNQEVKRIEGLNASKQATPATRTISTDWHPTLRLPVRVAEPNLITTTTYDNAGRVLTRTQQATTDADGTQGFNASLTGTARTWTNTYNIQGQLISTQDPAGAVTAYTYYPDNDSCTGCRGQIHAVTQVLDAAATPAVVHTTINNAYDALGRLLESIDPNGVKTRFTYDWRGNITSRTDAADTADAAITSYQTFSDPNDAGRTIKRTVHPDGGLLDRHYDAADRLVAESDLSGNKIEYTLDNMGNRIAEQIFDPQGNLRRASSRAVDAFGALTEQRDADNNATGYAYDAIGNVTRITDPLNRNTAHQYDTRNRLTQTTDAMGGIIRYAYDKQDRITEVTDPRGLVTRYVYNGFGEVISQTSPDTGETTYQYDNAGRLISSTDAKGQITTYAYDNLNRLIQSQVGSLTTTYTYDQGANGLGRLTHITDPSGTTQYGYDILGNVIQKTQTVGNRTLTVNYQYQNNRLAQIAYPSGTTVHYQYANGQPTGITVNNAPLMTNITTEPFGAISGWTWGNGETHERTYDQNGRLIGLSLPDMPPAQNLFAYDNLNRIIEAEALHNNQQTKYLYDATGNRTGIIENGDYRQYQTEGNSNRLTKVLGVDNVVTASYQYDAVGSTISKTTPEQTDAFQYDERGRLIQANGTAYKINALEQRVEKATTNQAIQFVYDEQGHLIGEYDALTGNPQIEHVWLNDWPVAAIKDSQVFHVYPNHLGTPRAIADLQNNVVWYWNYDEPFGKTEPNDEVSGTQFVYNLRFPGQYYDEETGLHYNWHRDYDAGAGRYVQSDPIGLWGGINTYGYVSGNAVKYIDPLGLNPVAGCVAGAWGGPVGCGTGAAIGAGIAIGLGAWATTVIDDDRDTPLPPPVIPRDIWWPDKVPGQWSCKARADCNDNIPDNCPEDPIRRFAFGGGVAKDLGTARNIAKSNATSNLQCQPKHVSCKCTGPKGEQYSGGC